MELTSNRIGFLTLTAAACLLVGGCDFMMSTQERVARAQEQLEKSNFGAARRDLTEILEKEPNDGRARFVFSRLSLITGDIETAQRDLDLAVAGGVPAAETTPLRYEILIAGGKLEEAVKGLESDTVLPPAQRLTLLGSAQTGLEKYADAEKSLAEAARLAPKDAEVRYQLARNQAAQDDVKGALASLDEALQLDPRFARGWLFKGALLQGSGQHAPARDAFLAANENRRFGLRPAEHLATLTGLTEAHLALNELDEAEGTVRRLSGLAPRSLPAAYLKGRLAYARKDYPLAVTELQRAVAITKQHLPSRLLLGAALMANGSPEQAHATLSEVLRDDPDNQEARALLAQVELARGDSNAAASLLATGTATGGAQGSILRGVASMRAGDVEGGLEILEAAVAASPNDSATRLALAEGYIVAGEVDKAFKVLEGIPQDERNATHRAVVMVAAHAAKATPEAQAEIEKLAAEHPRDAAVLTAAGAFLASRGQTERGTALLQKAIAADPKDVRARLALAGIEMRGRHFDGAEKQLEEALKIAPRNQNVHIGLAEVAYARGDRAAARTRLEAALTADPSAVEARVRLALLAFADNDASRGRALLDQAVTASGGNPRIQYVVGRVLVAAGDNEAAVTRLSTALDGGVPEAALDGARANLALKRPADARAMLEKALQKRPGWLAAEGALAQLDVREGNAAAAFKRIDALRTRKDLNPGVADELAGDIRMLAGQAAAAGPFYDRALTANPDSPELLLKKYRMQRAAKAPDSVKTLTAWLARRPGDSAVRHALASAHQEGGQRAPAVSEYERLVKDNPADIIALNNLAWLYYESGDARAVQTAKKAYDGAPNQGEIADTYGWILVETGKHAEGKTVLERAASGSPDPEIKYHLAVAHARSGDKRAAERVLRPLIESGAAFPSRQRAQQLLQEVAG